jgi:hypothetical protein
MSDRDLHPFDLKQEKVTLKVPTSSILDEHALDLIVRESDQEAWSRALGVEPLIAKQCLRDHQLIWRMGSARERKVEHRVQYRAWISKRRTTLDFEERTASTPQWVTVRAHWALSFPWPEVEAAYPFMDFFTDTPPPEDDEDDEQESMGVGTENEQDDLDEPADDEDDQDEEDDHDNDDGEALKLKNGENVYGLDLAGEYEEFTIRVVLNKLGRRLYRHVRELVRLGFVTVDQSRAEFLSAAPWDNRSV